MNNTITLRNCPSCGLRTRGNDICSKCNADTTIKQTSERSNDSEYTGSIIKATRGYHVRITDSYNNDISHTLTQKETKKYEKRTGKKKQELANYLAISTTSIKNSFNGKFSTSSFFCKIEEKKEIITEELTINNKKGGFFNKIQPTESSLNDIFNKIEKKHNKNIAKKFQGIISNFFSEHCEKEGEIKAILAVNVLSPYADFKFSI